MKLIKLLFISVLYSVTNLMATPSLEPAGSGIVSGRIYDAGSGNAVEYANIVLYQEGSSMLINGTVSDVNGNFELREIKNGKYYLKIQFIGYKPYTTDIFQISGSQKTVKFESIQLVKSTNQLEEVDVVAEKSQVEYKIDKKVINVDKNLSSASGSAADILQNTPSVQTDMDGNVILRGSSNYTVLINGKPSPLQGSDALRQIPANSIESIELITNPSAKYDPDGTTGIINIITKKEKAEGLNGLINSNIGTQWRSGLDGLFNYRTGKINYYFGGSYSQLPHNSYMTVEREIQNTDTAYYYMNSADHSFSRISKTAQAGADWDINEKSILGINITGGNFEMERDFDSFTHEISDPAFIDTYKASKDNLLFDIDYISGSIRYDYSSKPTGQNLSTELLWAYTSGRVDQEASEWNTNSNFECTDSNPFKKESHNRNSRNEIRLKADYSKAFSSSSKLEAGVQAYLLDKTIDIDFLTFDYINDTWYNDPAYSNDIEFHRYIYNAYLIYSGKLVGFDYQAGVRSEYVDRLLYQKSMNTKYYFDDIQVYPSLHISRSFKNDHQLQLSYSRRITRPQDYWLNPFPDYTDSYYISKGNPDLKPEFSDSYELNHQKKIKFITSSTTLYYRITHDLIQRTERLISNNMTLLTFQNLNSDVAYGAEISPSAEIAKWCRLNLSLNLFHYSINGTVDNYDVTNDVNTWSTQLMAIFSLTQQTRFQVSGSYNGRSLDTQGDLDPIYMVNASIRQEFFNRKLVAGLQLMNIFKTGEYRITTKGIGFNSKVEVIPESPIVSVSLSYRLNNFRKAIRPGNEQPNIDQGTF